MTLLLAMLSILLLVAMFTFEPVVSKSPSFAVTLPVRSAGPRPRDFKARSREWPEPRPP